MSSSKEKPDEKSSPAATDFDKESISTEVGSDSPTPPEINEIFENVPTEVKRDVIKVVEEFGMMGIGHISRENEVAKKITEEHITNYLDGAKEQMNNDYKERHERKIFTTVLVTLALAFFIIVIVLLKQNTDVLEKIIYSVGGLIAGAFGGYGFGRRKSESDD